LTVVSETDTTWRFSYDSESWWTRIRVSGAEALQREHGAEPVAGTGHALDVKSGTSIALVGVYGAVEIAMPGYVTWSQGSEVCGVCVRPTQASAGNYLVGGAYALTLFHFETFEDAFGRLERLGTIGEPLGCGVYAEDDKFYGSARRVARAMQVRIRGTGTIEAVGDSQFYVVDNSVQRIEWLRLALRKTFFRMDLERLGTVAVEVRASSLGGPVCSAKRQIEAIAVGDRLHLMVSEFVIATLSDAMCEGRALPDVLEVVVCGMSGGL
jgi:hypothetical protein